MPSFLQAAFYQSLLLSSTPYSITSLSFPPLLSFPSHTNCLSLWKLASLANPCSDRRAKCVLLTINIT